jgi:tetratricopeptide (TPR) repeat protein
MRNMSNYIIGLLLASSIFLSGCQKSLDPQKNLAHYYKEGEKAVLSQSYESAIDYYDQALVCINEPVENLEMDITRGILYFSKGYCFEQLGETEKAIELYLLAYEDDSSKVIASIALGSLYFDLEKYKLSKTYFEEAIALDEKAYEAYVNLSALYSLEKDRQMALSLLTQAIEIDEQKPDAYLNRAYLFACMGDEDLMKADIEKLKELKFSSLDVYIKIFNDTLEEVQR